MARHAEEAGCLARRESQVILRNNLSDISQICSRLVKAAPTTFREACQWLVFFQAGAKMYNGSGEWGQLDELLRPFYERDRALGILDDDDAVFHIACLLLSETAYAQLGGPDADGNDMTSPVSFLILEAIHQLKIPANIGVRVEDGVDPALLHRGVEILFEDKMGFPKFVGGKSTIDGFMRAGFPLETARTRTYAGCHWLAIPGREYCMADLIKIDFAKLLDISIREVTDMEPARQSAQELWGCFRQHLQNAVRTTAEAIDFHLAHMHRVLPELYLDLFCHGPVEKGLDASNGGVEFTNIGVDGASLATVADSFAAIEERVDREKQLTWKAMVAYLDADWDMPGGERARTMMSHTPRFGSGDSLADAWAVRISRTFSEMVIENPTPAGATMIPGLFSWAKVIPFGQRLGATPDGRRAGTPVSHGPNPQPCFNAGKPGTPTQMVHAVAAVQPGYGNTAPLQLDLDPGLGRTDEDLRNVEALIRTHFDLGGTLININVLNRDDLLKAQANPEQYPDLIVRVTGFSTYFASLSDTMRKFVVDRIVAEQT